MKIGVLGAGAMGSTLGALLARAGHDLTFIDVSRETIDAINANGLRLDDKQGGSEIVRVRATDKPAEPGTVDLLLVLVKCYQTETALKNAAPMIGPKTTVLSLQNGWGNGPRIAGIVGPQKLLLGVCYHSATVLGPGHVLHAGRGMTFLGEPDGAMSERLQAVSTAFNQAGIEVTPTPHILKEIWSKLALNAVTLPTSATTRLTADRLLDTSDLQHLMRELLQEVVAVAAAQGLPLDFKERWEAITGLLKKLAPNSKPSMLQDVEKGRRTEIDVISGAVVEAGLRLGLATPYNNAMVALVKAVEQGVEK